LSETTQIHPDQARAYLATDYRLGLGTIALAREVAEIGPRQERTQFLSGSGRCGDDLKQIGKALRCSARQPKNQHPSLFIRRSGHWLRAGRGACLLQGRCRLHRPCGWSMKRPFDRDLRTGTRAPSHRAAAISGAPLAGTIALAVGWRDMSSNKA